MCGIVGYVGGKSALEPVIDGLKALEYRGYDSAGIAALTEHAPIVTKQVGQVANLESAVQTEHKLDNATIAIGHTRWATHGEPSIKNAHPHFNNDRTIFVVHNGIIENYQDLKARLQKANYKFVSETDTEVIPHLIDWHLKKTKDFESAFEKAITELKGAYAIVAMYTHEPNTLYAARLSSPMVIGVDKDAHYIASDPSAILTHTKKALYLDDYDIAVIAKTDVKIHNIKESADVHRGLQTLDLDATQARLGDFPDFMLKEIFDGPATVQSATRGRVREQTSTVKLGGLEAVAEQLRFIDRIVIVACGTSYYAGLIGEYLIEEIAGIPVEVQLASEFKYRHEPFSRSTALLAISQSGETADTIAALKKVESYGVLRLGVVNVVGSTIARMTDAGVYCHAGPEQSVASTKAFIAQVTVLTEIALFLSKNQTSLHKPIMKELLGLPKKMEEVLASKENIKKIAHKYKDVRDFLYIGRGYGYPCALEGALKLKEVSYIHAEGYAAGEMKHGPLAMIDKSFPTFALACDSPYVDKVHSNLEEIKARGGPIIAIATKDDGNIAKLTKDIIYIPKTLEQLQPILVAPVLQLFAYYIATSKKLNVDRPRNLAKSVTVE